jgi:hypothetical protein
MEEKENTPKYHVYDRQTGERANKTEYKSRAGARRAVDKLDNEYGGYRYHVKPAETSTGGGRGGMGSEGKELAKDVKAARRIEKEELGKMGMQQTPKTKTPRLGGVGGGGMNPIDLEKVPGRRPLKMAKGGKVRSSCDGIAKKGKTKGRMV